MWSDNGDRLVTSDSLHPPQLNHPAQKLWWQKADAGNYHNLILETMYPQYLLGDGEELSRAMDLGLQLAVDVHKALHSTLQTTTSSVSNKDITLCFRAKGEPKQNTIPEWLSVEISFDAKQPRCYSIWIIPEIATVAIVLGTLEIDGSVSGWIGYLESLGFEDVVLVSSLEFFGQASRPR